MFSNNRSVAGLALSTLGFVVFSAVASYPALGADGFTAKILDPKNRATVLFTYKHSSEPKGDARIATNTYSDPEGKVVAIETVEFVKDGEREKVRSYRMSQKQLGAEGSVEIKGEEANFTYVRDGKTKTSKEKVGDDFIVGPSLVAHLQRNWDKILKGETIKTRFAVLDRVETVGFQFFKEKEAEISGKKAIVVKMKPSSLIIAALVNPLYFYMEPDGSRLLELHGRTQVKRKDGSGYKDLDAVTVYEY